VAAADTSPLPKSVPERIYFADHLRVALVILVILHHLSVIYAANTPFYYLEPAKGDYVAVLVLVLFQLLNQAYFMGLFFLLSGYFSPGSFDRKGPAQFLKDRLLRLGIPLLVFLFALNPIASLGIYQMPASLTGITTPLTWHQYPNLIAMGPMWFVAMLLVFDLGYAALRVMTSKRASPAESKAACPAT
jgi:glucan biosynthesis protein C